MNRPFARLGIAAATLLVALSPALAMNIQRVVSPGGVEAWLVEDYAVPIIALNFAFAGGSAQDPAGKPGVGSILEAVHSTARNRPGSLHWKPGW